jgi:hypothetical protein
MTLKEKEMLNITYKDKKIEQVLISGMDMYHFQEALAKMRASIMEHANLIREKFPAYSVSFAFEDTLEKIAKG